MQSSDSARRTNTSMSITRTNDFLITAVKTCFVVDCFMDLFAKTNRSATKKNGTKRTFQSCSRFLCFSGVYQLPQPDTHGQLLTPASAILILTPNQSRTSTLQMWRNPWHGSQHNLTTHNTTTQLAYDTCRSIFVWPNNSSNYTNRQTVNGSCSSRGPRHADTEDRKTVVNEMF